MPLPQLPCPRPTQRRTIPPTIRAALAIRVIPTMYSPAVSAIPADPDVPAILPSRFQTRPPQTPTLFARSCTCGYQGFRGRGAAADTLDGSARQWDTEFGTMFLREPQLPKHNRKYNRRSNVGIGFKRGLGAGVGRGLRRRQKEIGC